MFQRLILTSSLVATLALAACAGGSGTSDGPGDGPDDGPGDGPGGTPGLYSHLFATHETRHASISTLDAASPMDLPEMGSVDYVGSVRFDLALPDDGTMELVGDVIVSAYFGILENIMGQMQNFHTEDHQMTGTLSVTAPFGAGVSFSGNASGTLSNTDLGFEAIVGLNLEDGEFVGHGASGIRARIGGGATIDGDFYDADGEMAASSGPH